ncbi:MAG: hypothetical protein KGR98_00330 [Verrucomicrobia bacterium]|nr:hypothetical protein [Verrucomicrobiota bacterium]MDE3098273.1 hypothetical protein [Verrucomicrobiota bacterium]
MSPREAATLVRDAMPADGLFAGQRWRISPAPFRMERSLAEELERLGRMLLQFYRAGNLLYRQSIAGRRPEWVARWLDLGKPRELIELQRSAVFKNDTPRVIRPDILLTEEGLKITELDSVPGGIGLTAWLNEVYTAPGLNAGEIIGGAEGMLRGFASLFGTARNIHIIVSDEAATYRPEMAWLSERLNGTGKPIFKVQPPGFDAFSGGDAVFRFFELFDLANVPCAKKLFDAALERTVAVTPPPKPALEEKMLLALLWNGNLRDFWRQELGESFFERLKRIVPYTWLLDPAPLPPHGAIPELNLTDWRQLKALSQRDRNVILKISGFSEKAWGARGVFPGSDLPAEEWAAAVDQAIAGFSESPFILQRFEKPKIVEGQQWFDFQQGAAVAMSGRVRLCPYYFVAGPWDRARPQLGGVLATIVPADKKIVHGMQDAILAPCAV